MKKIAVGIDIGGTNSVFGLVDQAGVILGESCISSRTYPDIDEYIEKLYLGIKVLLKKLDFEYEIIGVGMGAPNANYHRGVVEFAPNLIWKGTIPFVDKMKRYFPNVPVVLTNDAKAAAVGEMIYGAARGLRDFIMVTLGTGLGSGFVSNGEVIYGHDGFAGELGHSIVIPGGRACGCGRCGCLETYASATGIRRTIFSLLAERREDSVLRNVTSNNLSAKMITEAAKDNDPIALAAFEYTGMMLGRALANAVTVTSPKAIFLFGGLAKAGNLIIEPTKRHMEENLLVNYKDKIDIFQSGLDDSSVAILGASALVWKS